MSNASLAGRLVARMTVFIMLGIVIVSAGFAALFYVHMDTLNDRSLREQAQDIIRRLNIDPETGVLVLALPEKLQQAYYYSSGQYLYLVTDYSGKVLLSSRSRAIPLFPAAQTQNAQPLYFSFTDPKSEWPYNGFAMGITLGGRNFTIQVGQGPIHPDVRLDDFLAEMWNHFA